MAKKVLIITPGVLPVPAIEGGAVETLIDQFLLQNASADDPLDITLYSIYNKKITKDSEFKNTNYLYVKHSKAIIALDNSIYWVIRKVLRKSPSASYNYILRRLHYYFKLKNYIKKHEDFDVILFENTMFNLKVLNNKKIAKNYKDKIVFHLHNRSSLHAKGHEFIKNLPVLTVSNYLKNDIVDMFKLDPSNVKVVYNCVPYAKKVDVNLAQKLNTGKFNLFFAGRIVEGKGILELVKAMKGLKNVKLFIAGGSFFGNNSVMTPYIKEIYKVVKKYNLDVEFLGYIPHEELPSWYKQADAVVLPFTEGEVFGLTLAEASDVNKNVITTEIGATTEIVGRDYMYLCKNLNNLEDDLHEMILKVIKNTEDGIYPKNGYNSSKFSSEAFYKNLREALL